MTLIDRLGGGLPRAPVTVELDDIQATVLRYRPESTLSRAQLVAVGVLHPEKDE